MPYLLYIRKLADSWREEIVSDTKTVTTKYLDDDMRGVSNRVVAKGRSSKLGSKMHP